MSDLKELIESLEKNIEKFKAAMDQAELLAKNSSEAIAGIIDGIIEAIKENEHIFIHTGERILSRKETKEYSEK